MPNIPKNIDDGLGIDEETRLKAYAGASLPVALATAVAIGIFTPPQNEPSIDAIRTRSDMIVNPPHPHEYIVVSGAYEIAAGINSNINGSLEGFKNGCKGRADEDVLDRHTQDRDKFFRDNHCPTLTIWLCNNDGKVTETTPRDPVVCNPPRRHRGDRASK